MSADPTDPTPALGQAAGVYQERAPLASLSRHFASTWFRTAPIGSAPKALIVPDGCMDLLWVNGTLRIAGPDREARVERIPPGTTVVGLRFQPGAAGAWLRVCASEVVGARMDLESFWGDEARRMADWASEARTPEGIAQRLERAMADKAAGIEQPDDMSRALYGLIGANPSPEEGLVRHLRSQLGLSERTLRRRCYDAFGYGPKTLDRILRFQRFLQLLRMPESAGLADVAAQAGYSDQSHLTRETHDLAGMTPSAILTQLAG